MIAARLGRTPLRTQLLALLLGTIALVVLVLTAASATALHRYLVERIDVQLSASAQRLAPEADRPPGRGPRGRGRDVAVDTLRYDRDGALLGGGAQGGPAISDPRRLPLRPVDVDGLGGGPAWRVLAVPVSTGGTVVLAVSLDGVQDTVRRLLVLDATVGLIAVLLAGAAGRLAVRRSLRPLVEVEQTAQAIAAGDLDVRVTQGDPRTEVGSLAASFNAMVDRFQEAWSARQASEAQARESEGRMRSFVADASHELRTPLTSIRGFAELYRQGAVNGPEQTDRVLRRIEDEASRMGLLVEDLLLLARLDQQRPFRQEPVDLLSVAADVVGAVAALHATTHPVLLLAGEVAEPPVVLGDDDRLHQVVSNLVTNAVDHTPVGTRVEVVVSREGAWVLLEVRDDGPGLAPDVAARVFERFYRADASRTRAGDSTTGNGLGLSIVHAIVAAHRGAVEVDSATGRGTTFRVRLPAQPGPATS